MNTRPPRHSRRADHAPCRAGSTRRNERRLATFHRPAGAYAGTWAHCQHRGHRVTQRANSSRQYKAFAHAVRKYRSAS